MNDLLKTKMTRKEFLFYVITLIIALSGISKLNELLSINNKRIINRQTKGFGSNPYGI